MQIVFRNFRPLCAINGYLRLIRIAINCHTYIFFNTISIYTNVVYTRVYARGSDGNTLSASVGALFYLQFLGECPIRPTDF